MILDAYKMLRRLEDVVSNEMVSDHLERLNDLKNANRKTLQDYRFDALKKMLNHAYDNVPFYRKRFRDNHITPNDIRSFKDFEAFPILTRKDIIENLKDIVSIKHKKETLISGSSSGSTGSPIHYFKDKSAYSAGRAAVLFGWELAGKRIGDKTITVWGNAKMVKEGWNRPLSRFKAFLYRDLRIAAYKLIDENRIKDAVKKISMRNGGYIYAYTNAIYSLALNARNRGIKLKRRFDGVLTTAETLMPRQREVIEDVFGPVYDGYGCGEILGIAFQCKNQKGYHLIEPNIIFEAGNRIDNNVSEIVVTDLWNYAMPLIRYKTGDLFEHYHEKCSCGCSWSLIGGIIGRISDLITTTQQGCLLIPSVFGSALLKDYPFIRKYQLAKISNDLLSLRLQVDITPTQEVFNAIRSAMDEYLNSSMRLEIELVDSFSLDKSGKHKIMVDETIH